MIELSLKNKKIITIVIEYIQPNSRTNISILEKIGKISKKYNHSLRH